MLALTTGELAGDSLADAGNVLFGLAVVEEVFVYVQTHVFFVLLFGEQPSFDRKVAGWLGVDSFLPSD